VQQGRADQGDDQPRLPDVLAGEAHDEARPGRDQLEPVFHHVSERVVLDSKHQVDVGVLVGVSVGERAAHRHAGYAPVLLDPGKGVVEELALQ